jgi:N-acyl-D-amino-acid deacylase
LLALAGSGGVSPGDPLYQRGVKFLLRTQGADGSWRVATRSSPQQLFFDNGDPHGKLQFISFTATNVAAMAVMLRLPEDATAAEAGGTR